MDDFALYLEISITAKRKYLSLFGGGKEQNLTAQNQVTLPGKCDAFFWLNIMNLGKDLT